MDNLRIGMGFDIHQLVENRKLILGGVEIPFTKGLLGHSDADVLLHAISDAILGALALGDIGHWFPDNDPQYAGADSQKLLLHIMKSSKLQGWKIINIDAVVMAEKPKLMPYVLTMRENIASLLKISLDCVSIKATTMEKLGAVGEEQGIAAQAVILLTKE